MFCSSASTRAADKPATTETFRYLRAAGLKFVPEGEIRLTRTAKPLIVVSVTRRGKQKLTVESRYDSRNVLQSAKVTIQRGSRVQTATVRVSRRKAEIVRDGRAVKTLAAPQGVIVTSAPDWTDSFMAVRRYDPHGEAAQTFPGLWIHPTREPLQLTIRLTHVGEDAVKLLNKTVKLQRLSLVLRGGSRYVVWRNPQGFLVRLIPAKSKTGGIVLAGWERATSGLKPVLRRN